MLLNPPLRYAQLLEAPVACNPRRPTRVAWCHLSLDHAARAATIRDFIFFVNGTLAVAHFRCRR